MKTKYLFTALAGPLIFSACGNPAPTTAGPEKPAAIYPDHSAEKDSILPAQASNDTNAITAVKKLPADFKYLAEMYNDPYFPNPLVDKVRREIQKLVAFLEKGNHSKTEVQAELDKMTVRINQLQDEFMANGSEIETVARESIASTVERILAHFDIDIHIETAIRQREW